MEEKPCKWGKVPDFSGLYKVLPNRKVILGILYKFFWLKLFVLIECGHRIERQCMKFRKRPVVIEATQWFKDGDHPAVWLDFVGSGFVNTLEGVRIVTPGDWIITGVKGECYPCKPDIFEMTYEPE
jgi:hypothetical protein